MCTGISQQEGDFFGAYLAVTISDGNQGTVLRREHHRLRPCGGTRLRLAVNRIRFRCLVRFQLRPGLFRWDGGAYVGSRVALGILLGHGH